MVKFKVRKLADTGYSFIYARVTGVSTFLTSKYGDPDYIEAISLPQNTIACCAISSAALSENSRTQINRDFVN